MPCCFTVPFFFFPNMLTGYEVAGLKENFSLQSKVREDFYCYSQYRLDVVNVICSICSYQSQTPGNTLQWRGDD